MHVQSIRKGELPIEYTSKPLSGWGGLSLVFEYLDRIGFCDQLRHAVKEMKSSNNRVENSDLVLTFLVTVLVGGNRFAHVQRIFRDEVVRRITGAKRLGSEDTVRRFFLSLSASEAEDLYTTLHQFTSTLLLRHIQEDVLDLDSTILERYGLQEGASKGYHSGRAGQQSHHPLLGMLSRAKHIALVWLRAGGAQTLRGADEFVKELLARLPAGFRITAIRADSGFFNEQYLRLFEERNIPYIIPIRMHPPITRFVASIPAEQWQPLDENQDIADVSYAGHGWARQRRVLAYRKRIKRDRPLLFDVPAYEFSALVTTLTETAHDCSVFYDQRGQCENTIKEFKNDFGARGFSLAKFTPTEAALRLVSILFNLVSEFKRDVLRDMSLTLATIRAKVFVIGAVLGRAARKIILRLGIRHPEQRFTTLLERASSATYATAPQLTSSA
ncbi:MAG: IS1380 family transposase [Thermoanaerobaculia bacterium]